VGYNSVADNTGLYQFV